MSKFRRWDYVVGMLLMVLLGLPAGAQNPNVTVDDQPTAEQRLEEVLELRRAQRYPEAAELVHELIDTGRFKLVSLGQGRYTDAGRWASDVLLRDRELLKAYTERYSAVAARALMQAVEADDRLGAAMDVYRLYAATTSGMDAGLLAAGLMLEAGDAQSAYMMVGVLLRHPEAESRRAQLLMLQGSSAAYLRDTQTLEDAAAQLKTLDTQAAGDLLQLAESVVPDDPKAGHAEADWGAKPVSIRAPLWDQALASAQGSARWLLDDRSVLPVVTPGAVLINNGRQVLSLDRASGQRSWAYPGDDDPSVQKMISAQRWLDQRRVALAEGKVVAVIGECHGITDRRNPYVPANELVCVDEQTGQLIWKRVAGEFEDGEPLRAADHRAGRINLQHTHFVGSPISHEGIVYVILRRANSEGDTQSHWLLAYDLAEGALLWYRHFALVTLSYTNADSMRVSPGLTLQGDTLYMSDGLGTVGALDRETGSYRWLSVMPVGTDTTRSIVASSRGIASAPVVTTAGLLVPLSLASDRLMLIDPEDGTLLRSFKQDPQLGKTQYILRAQSGVLVVAQTALMFWDAGQAAVTWTFTLAPGEEVLGMGDCSLRFAVIPTNQRLLVLDLATGERIEDAPPVGGSVLVQDGELIAIGGGRVHAYTSWDRVYRRLVEQVQSRPDDPAAGLSLASVAMRQEGQAESVLLGVGHALDAVDRQPARRKAAVASHVFDQLRALIPQSQDPELRHQLYERLAQVTQTAAHEAAYHLDAGIDFARMGRAELAVDHLHAVIAEPVFASVAYEADGVTRPAGTVAQEQLESMFEIYGRGIYARYDALAQVSIDELRVSGNLNAAALTQVAKRFPLSPLSGQLLLDAADARFAQGQFIAAADLYKQAVQRAVTDAQRQDAAGRLIHYYLKVDRPDYASDFLTRFTQRYPGLIPTLNQQPVTLQTWHAQIASHPGVPSTAGPLAARLGDPLLLPGKLILAEPSAQTSVTNDRIYLQNDNPAVTCHNSDRPTRPLWTAKLPADAASLTLLADQGGQVLFWSSASAQVLAYDSATGDLLWHTSLGSHVTNTPRQERAQNDSARPSDWLVAVSETVLCFGHRDSAQVFAVDRASGGFIWQTSLEMTQLTAMHADNWSIAVVGRAGHPQQLRSGKLAVLTLSDAQPILNEGQARIALTPFAVVLRQQQALVLGSTGLMAVDLPSGQTAWSQRFSEKLLTGTHAFTPSFVAAETSDGEVHVMDLTDQGKPLASVVARRGLDRVATQITAQADVLWCLGTRGVFRLADLQKPGWSDAIQTPDLTPGCLVVGEDHVILIAESPAAAGEQMLKLFALEASGGRLLQTYDLPLLSAPAQPLQAKRLGSGLVIPLDTQTLVLPPA